MTSQVGLAVEGLVARNALEQEGIRIGELLEPTLVLRRLQMVLIALLRTTDKVTRLALPSLVLLGLLNPICLMFGIPTRVVCTRSLDSLDRGIHVFGVVGGHLLLMPVGSTLFLDDGLLFLLLSIFLLDLLIGEVKVA